MFSDSLYTQMQLADSIDLTDWFGFHTIRGELVSNFSYISPLGYYRVNVFCRLFNCLSNLSTVPSYSALRKVLDHLYVERMIDRLIDR